MRALLLKFKDDVNVVSSKQAGSRRFWLLTTLVDICRIDFSRPALKSHQNVTHSPMKIYTAPSIHQRTGRGSWGGCSPPCQEKNSIIRAKLMYNSGKDSVRWDTCCSERQLTTEGKRPLSYHSLLHLYWQSRQWASIKVWGQWPGGFVRIGRNRIQPFYKHQQHPNCMKILWRV